MAEATDLQMQQFANDRIRPGAELVRRLVVRLQSDKAVIGDMYARAVGTGNWDDNRNDVPIRLDEQSMLKYNAFIDSIVTAITTHGEYANIMAMCVQAAEIQ